MNGIDKYRSFLHTDHSFNKHIGVVIMIYDENTHLFIDGEKTYGSCFRHAFYLAELITQNNINMSDTKKMTFVHGLILPDKHCPFHIVHAWIETTQKNGLEVVLTPYYPDSNKQEGFNNNPVIQIGEMYFNVFPKKVYYEQNIIRDTQTYNAKQLVRKVELTGWLGPFGKHKKRLLKYMPDAQVQV